MILLNWTGLARIYWVPSIKRKSDGWGIWFCSVRWVGLEVVFYSKAMATEFINRLNCVDREATTEGRT